MFRVRAVCKWGRQIEIHSAKLSLNWQINQAGFLYQYTLEVIKFATTSPMGDQRFTAPEVSRQIGVHIPAQSHKITYAAMK